MERPVTLLIPEKTDIEFEEIFSTWTQRGGKIKRLGKYWIKDEELAKQPIAIYGNQTFSLVLAQIYNVQLISPDDTVIARLSRKWTKRDITVMQAGQITPDMFPVFIKPVIPKAFMAAVFQNITEFKDAMKGLPDTEEILVSEIVTIEAEARSFVQNGVVKDAALYEGDAVLEKAATFFTDFAESNKNELPEVVVVDFAYNRQLGWFVLEFNACWGAGLNGCSADKVVDCIVSATVNIKENAS
ncbi:ATP-grasp domain-containing protein [Chitinophagaceae bacterium MMS25-I14]